MRFEWAAAMAVCAGLVPVAPSHAGARAPDAAARAALAGAAFKPVAAPPAPPRPPARGRGTVLYASRFVPGRGVVTWSFVPGEAPPEAAFAVFPYIVRPDGSPVELADLVYVSDWRAPYAGPSEAYAGLSPRDPLRREEDEERLFLFAAIKGRGYGYDFGEAERNSVRIGWGGFSGRAQAGLAHVRGGVQTTVGYAYERIRFHNNPQIRRRHDHRFGVNVIWRPEYEPDPLVWARP